MVLFMLNSYTLGKKYRSIYGEIGYLGFALKYSHKTSGRGELKQK